MKKLDTNSAEIFACYLIDNCEGSIITEELIYKLLGDMLKDDLYNVHLKEEQKNEK